MMPTLSIDPGLTGAAVFQTDDHLEWWYWRHAKGKTRLTTRSRDGVRHDSSFDGGPYYAMHRLGQMVQFMTHLAARVIVEDQHVSRDVRGALSLARYSGAMIACVTRSDLEPTIVHPSEWRMKAGMPGNMSRKMAKGAAVGMAREIWPEAVNWPEDVCEAAIMGRAYATQE